MIKDKNLAASRLGLYADEIERLQAERDAFKADAERYRWLRGDSCPDRLDHMEQFTGVPPASVDRQVVHLRRAELDAAIDAARSKEQK